MRVPLRVAFAGTPEFAATALQAILATGFEVTLVLTQPDRPAGRGLKSLPSAVKALALSNNLALVQPLSLRLDGRYAADAAAAQAALRAAQPDVMVVAAYGLILPAWALSLPGLGCLNIHASLLPRWRGAAPIQRAIEAGDLETGVTIMRMDAGLDTGPMVLVERTLLRADDTSARLHVRLAAMGADLIVKALITLADRGGLPSQVQPELGVTYAQKIAKTEATIDWTQDATRIERQLRAFDPFPGANFQWQGEVVKLWRAQVVDTALLDSAVPGTILSSDYGRLVIACGRGALALEEVQRPGGRRQAIDVWQRAAMLEPGMSLSSVGY